MQSLWSLRHRLSRLCPLIVGLLVFSTVASGLHHHADGADHADCAVCSATHAPAEHAVLPDIAPAPIRSFERVVLVPRNVPLTAAAPTPPSRAPPES
jgi:hypothetical protein